MHACVLDMIHNVAVAVPDGRAEGDDVVLHGLAEGKYGAVHAQRLADDVVEVREGVERVQRGRVRGDLLQLRAELLLCLWMRCERVHGPCRRRAATSHESIIVLTVTMLTWSSRGLGPSYREDECNVIPVSETRTRARKQFMWQCYTNPVG